MTKHWPTIKRVLYGCYVLILWICIVSNAYMGKPFVACIFLALFALNLLDGGLDKIATAIRTQRNWHIIGDANEINLKGSSLYADSVSIKDRTPRSEARQ